MAQNKKIIELERRITELELENKQLLKLVSHDVKSPFNKLYALSNLLLMVSENLNEEQLDYLNRMEWVIKEGLAVVRNLMDLRAIENNNIELSIEDLQIDEVLDEIFKNYAKQIKAKNISIGSNICKVTGRSDKRTLGKIFDNLVSNAVKFSLKESEITISLFTNNGLIILEVITQSGPIPLEETGNLFNRRSPLSDRKSVV